jgi:hypothetical protein
MEPVIEATPSELRAAFTEWDRRWREDPEAFWTESDKLAVSPETYGEAATPYFLEILAEVQAAAQEASA